MQAIDIFCLQLCTAVILEIHQLKLSGFRGYLLWSRLVLTLHSYPTEDKPANPGHSPMIALMGNIYLLCKFNAAPRQGHREKVFHLVGFLHKCPDRWVKIDSSEPRWVEGGELYPGDERSKMTYFFFYAAKGREWQGDEDILLSPSLWGGHWCLFQVVWHKLTLDESLVWVHRQNIETQPTPPTHLR